MRPRSAAAALILLAFTCAAAQDPVSSAARIVVKSARLTDNGDNDGFADPHETVNVFLTLRNVSDTPRSGVKVAITSDDPRVDCVLTSVAAFGSLGARETREGVVPVSFRVAGVARATPEEELTATLNVLIWGDDFDALTRPQQVTVDLDLNVSGGVLSTSFTEGFEGAGFGSFTTMSLDVGRESLVASDGHRCQYNDPDFENSNSYGRAQCFLGGDTPAQNGYDWHVHGLGSPDGGRAYLGNNALHYGVHPGAPGADTTRLRQLDAIRTNFPVNLGWNGVISELSFKQQVGLVDTDYVSGEPFHAVDRGIVQIQLANAAGAGVGPWRKISPYENLYASAVQDNYNNCQFDPTDDGNTEDDYFDPADPDRRLGPSSTCAPEFVFSREGQIFYTSTFDPADTEFSTDGPGLQGSRGPGTWVQTKFSLDRWRGRRIRVRFLVSSLELAFCGDGTWGSCIDFYPGGPSPADDGWYIDDVQISNTTIGAPTVTVDTADRSALPGCPAACSSLSASLVADPNPSSVPGEPIVLDASGSSANSCPGGFLYRFWHDRDDNGVLGEPVDKMLHSWTEDPILVVAPHHTKRYAVEVVCPSRVSCGDSADVLLTVPCIVPYFNSLRFAKSACPENSSCVDYLFEISWDAPGAVDVFTGDLDALRASGGAFQETGSGVGCSWNDVFLESYFQGPHQYPGRNFYYLVREAGPVYACNSSWGTGSPAELPGAGGDRDADLALNPEACP
ncbi:MAG TPA: hypothetical protein VFV75_18055 [Candidatus Polarisedimenticolaceae bacterium]|nr:hypothetical protein [Candidatus Polarisedimenticolaceae bacterium]